MNLCYTTSMNKKIELKLNADNTWSVTRGGNVVSTHDTIKAAVDAKFDLKQAGKK